MTKEEAIELVKSAFDVWEDKYSVGNDMNREHKARDMAIKALEQEPCEDCISRHAVLETIDNRIEQLKRDVNEINKSYSHLSFAEGIHDGYCRLKCDLRILSSVTPQPKTGHWIDIMVGDMPAQACDKCNTFYPLAYTGGGHKYCPNCGSKMEVKE